VKKKKIVLTDEVPINEFEKGNFKIGSRFTA
jgi:hypothetical protein